MQFPEHYKYLFNGHQELLTEAEIKAWRNLQVERLIELCEYPVVKNLYRSRWINRQPEVLELLEKGVEYFYKSTLQRLVGKTHHCPKCAALCRTSRARICPKCSYSWYP